MPDHLVRHLIEIGRIDADGISRRAHATRCRKCTAVVLVGLDDDKCAAPVQVDPPPLTRIGEVTVLLAGGHTFDLTYTSRGYRIDPRRSWDIKAHPAGSVEGSDVVAGHRCGSDPPPSAQSRITKRSRALSDPNEPCPF
jgi:hypothetical protein